MRSGLGTNSTMATRPPREPCGLPGHTVTPAAPPISKRPGHKAHLWHSPPDYGVTL